MVADAAQKNVEREQAVWLSAPGSKVSLGAICNAVYKAVKAQPEEAAEIYAEVLEQRTTWKASECAAIFRSVLMARPDLKGNLNSYVRTYRGGKNAKDAAPKPADIHPELYDMLNALYNASLEDGVPENTVNEIMGEPGYVPALPPVPPPGESPVNFIVTPGDMSTGH